MGTLDWSAMAFVAGVVAISAATPIVIRNVEYLLHRKSDRQWESRSVPVALGEMVGRELKWMESRTRLNYNASFELRDGDRILATFVHRLWVPGGIAEGELLGVRWRLSRRYGLTFRDATGTRYSFSDSAMLGRRESRRESVTMRRITVPNGAAYIMRQERGDSSITISDTQGRLLLRQRYEGPSGSRVRRSIALSWGDSGAEPYQRVRLEPGSEEIPEVKWLLLWCLWRVAFADWASNQVTGIA